MEIMNDNKISLKSKGTYLVIKYLIDNDKSVSINDIMKYCSDGERLIRSAINELIENGYISRSRYRVDGKLKGIKYTIDK